MYAHGDVFMNILSDIKPKNFLEIGVFTGVNAKNICEYLYSIHKNDFKYFGLDLFEDYDDRNDNEIAPTSIRGYKQKFSNPLKHIYYNIFKNEQLNSISSVNNFLKRFKSNISLVKGDTKDTLKNIDLSNFDMVYVDGGHSYNTVYYEINYLLDHTKNNCFILCDDYLHSEAKGVKEAIDKIVTEKNLSTKIYSDRFASIIRNNIDR